MRLTAGDEDRVSDVSPTSVGIGFSRCSDLLSLLCHFQ